MDGYYADLNLLVFTSCEEAGNGWGVLCEGQKERAEEKDWLDKLVMTGFFSKSRYRNYGRERQISLLRQVESL